MELVKFFQSGGFFMYPILVVFALGLAIIVERYLYLRKASHATSKMWSQLMPMLKASDYKRAQQMVETSKTPLSAILSYGFSQHNANKKRETVEAAMEEGMMDAVPRPGAAHPLPGHASPTSPRCSDCWAPSSA
ncbi:MAG: hypothetical protein MZV65_53385 [Chromatiales bacterium]|nr:hypothetical protein [Chromatiales bacterium]